MSTFVNCAEVQPGGSVRAQDPANLVKGPGEMVHVERGSRLGAELAGRGLAVRLLRQAENLCSQKPRSSKPVERSKRGIRDALRFEVSERVHKFQEGGASLELPVFDRVTRSEGDPVKPREDALSVILDLISEVDRFASSVSRLNCVPERIESERTG